MSKSKLVSADGSKLKSKVPKMTGVHPFGSLILIELLDAEDLNETSIELPIDAAVDGAPQAYVVELGPKVADDAGIKVGQRIYWGGNCTPVNDPRSNGRLRGLLEVHQIKGLVSEEGKE